MPAWSGLYDGVYSAPYSTIGKPNTGLKVRRALKGLTALKYKQILRTFITDDVGTTATKTHARIAAQDNTDMSTLGGKRLTQTVTDINRAITAADETALLVDVDGVHTPTFPVEKSGNSGGGKLGF